MPTGTEDELHEELWNWLEANDYEVGGEVNVENGHIDLVGEKNDQYIGFEVKTIHSLWADAGVSNKEAKSTLQQVNKYMQSGFFDEVYLCCQRSDEVYQKLYTAGKSLGISVDTVDTLGTVEISLNSESQTEFVEEAEQLHRTETPTLSRTNEPWVQHQVWNWANKGDRLAVREGLLPRHNFVDITITEGSPDVTEILRNQTENAHIGIEVKGENKKDLEDFEDQLKNYIDSGGLTHLYVAIPETRKDRIIPEYGQQTLSWSNSPVSSKVGFITVDQEGCIDIIQEPDRIEMKFDGIRCGSNEYNPVGLGRKDQKDRSEDEFESVSHWYFHNRM